ncbi:MAG: hypothetical protein RBT46_05065 [Weeksellaceae bacterium]|jgi:hypothetical protein|nr:hypothetical protein [Weeksellaceae bacterium]MDX9705058.1 hypothetical protein [Weeksellaceae bacterium]
MKKNLFTLLFSFSFFSILIAQESKTLNFNTSEINENEKLVLSENWQTYIDDNTILVYNGSINNESGKKLTNFNLDLYLVPRDLDIRNGAFKAFFITSQAYPSIDKNAKMVRVNIKEKLRNPIIEGLYTPLLVLSRKGKVLDIHKVENLVKIEDKLITLYQPEMETTVDTSLNPVVKISVNEDRSVSLEKEWKVEIDLANMLVKIIGGDIANNTNSDIQELSLNVFLTRENQAIITKNFEGLLIASADLNKPIEKNTKFVDTSITTNARQIPQSGTYYILLTLSSKDENGNIHVRNKIAFPNAVSF